MHGRWIDVTFGKDFVCDEINEMLAESPIPDAAEWVVHDYDDFFSFRMDEYPDIAEVCEIAEFIQEHGELGAEILTNYHGDIKDAKEAMENYHGEWDSEVEYATQLFDDLYGYDIPENISFYIDYEAFSHALFINDCFSIEIDHRVHVFSFF